MHSLQNSEESQQNHQPKSQIDKIRKQNTVSVAIVEDRAFWVKNNKFYTSNIVDGYIDDVNASEIDAHSLSDNEINLLLEILDELNS